MTFFSECDTTFWLKPWLKSFLFGSYFFHLAKVLPTTNFQPELALDKNIMTVLR